VHGAGVWSPTDFWGEDGQTGNGESTVDIGYKLLRRNPSGVGDAVATSATGQLGAPAVDSRQVNQYTLGVWCASCHDKAFEVQNGTSEETTFAARPKSGNGWHKTDPVAERLPEGTSIDGVHSTVLTGVYSGPGQCYTCHRGSLPADPDLAEAFTIGTTEQRLALLNPYRALGYFQLTNGASQSEQLAQQNANLTCSRCHFGTADFAFFSPGSDWPHRSIGDVSMLGDWTREPGDEADGFKPGDALTVQAGDIPDTINYTCQRCHIRPVLNENAYIISHRVPDHAFNFADFLNTIGLLNDQYSPGYQAP
jgi:cytochrome c553